MSCSSGRTQPLPFSTGVIFSPGKRVHRPWPMAEATVSMIARCPAPMMAANARAARERRELVVADALPLVEVALVAAVGGVHADDDVGLLHELPERVELRRGRTTAGPRKPGTGAGRMRMILAPRSSTHSSSSIAFSTIGSVITGVGKMRSS